MKCEIGECTNEAVVLVTFLRHPWSEPEVRCDHHSNRRWMEAGTHRIEDLTCWEVR